MRCRDIQRVFLFTIQTLSQSITKSVSQSVSLSVFTVLRFSGMDASDSLDSVYTAVKVYRPKGRELAIADPLGVR
jgi:hypothetical protein